MTTAFVNPEILVWSRLRAGLTTHQLAAKLPVKVEKLTAWEGGDFLPTFRQAQKWASSVHIPFGYLFLSAPPVEHTDLPDLRTVGSQAIGRPSLNLTETIKEVLRKQQWFQEYLQDNRKEPLPFIGKFDIRTPVEIVVQDIRSVLSLPNDANASNSEEYMRQIIGASEDAGILVMRSGVANGNTHRKLDVSEFRGFAISDALAPVIFINSADAPAARLFTLVHELAHLWIGSTGISDGISHGARKEEQFCNAVAGEFLVPEKDFMLYWKDRENWEDNIPALTAKFHVSKFVIARRASDLERIGYKQFQAFYLRELAAYRQRETSGGDYYATAGAKNSKLFSRAIISETKSGRLLFRDAGNLLGIGPEKIQTYAAKLAP